MSQNGPKKLIAQVWEQSKIEQIVNQEKAKGGTREQIACRIARILRVQLGQALNYL